MGKSIEDLILELDNTCKDLEEAQKSQDRCRHYALAITKIEEAIHWLQASLNK